ncbi:hypothetical protein TSUD_153560 [Trifolium subterraneum]|uniref:RNase H type-1 domain-containing protein n=1 Tax=Trifolium subterraneum TaxID=3900 RepID=A0A2Z6NMR5_TRISU|nr:hypothetical protein TSUD_153560 [Trifolium subterraneum]
MSGGVSNDGGPSMNLQAAIGEINHLKAKIAAIEQEKEAEKVAEAELEEIQESQPLTQALWESQVPTNFKIPQLPTFEGKSDPLEHIMAVGTQTTIIGAEDHLRCKLLSSTFKDAAFIRQNGPESLHEYLARFSEATIKVSNPNQEMFVAAFQNGLKVGHFNELLAQKPAESMQEIMKRAECYIKGEESNAEKRSRDSRERGGNKTPDRYQRGWQPRDREDWQNRGGKNFRQNDRRPRQAYEEYSPLNSAKAAKGEPQKPPGSPREPPQNGKEKETSRVAVNTISGGFAGGGELSSARKRYLRGIINATNSINHTAHNDFSQTPDLSFSPKDASGIVPHDDDPLVIQVQILNCDVKRVLIDSGSSADIMYWEAFKAMQLASEQLRPYHDTLVGFTGDQAEVMGHITLLTTFGDHQNAKTIKVRYLVVKTPFASYNIIIGRPAFNTLGAAMSTLYLSIKYPLDNGGVGIVRGDQALGEALVNTTNMSEATELDPREEFHEGRVSPIEDLEEIKIGSEPHQVTNIGTTLPAEEKDKVIETLRRNVDLFAWHPKDMPGIDESIITHKLAIHPDAKPVSQRKRKVGEERRAAIDEEVDKLRKANFIEEIKYPEWLANVVMNAGTTYQRLMDRVFQKQIGKNLEVYIDDMVVKTAKEGDHDRDLEEILKEVRRYNMRLNPAKCSFGVQAGKFLGFMLTSRGIEANPEKCQAIINMRSPTTVKEVQQLTGRIAALSRFLSCADEKSFHFFTTLKKSEKFTWTVQCEEAFQKLKAFLASPPVLSRPKQGTPLTLYLAVSENAMSAALVQEEDGEERPVYFISRIFRDAESRYQNIEKLSLAVIVTARRLRHYFQSHRIMVKTDYPIKQVLQKPDLAGRMVAWSVELSEFDIVFSPRGSIKSQVLANFVLEMTTPPEVISTQPWTLSVYGTSNLRGSGAGVVLEGPDGVLIEQSVHFAFKASNNQAKYEALIAGRKLAKEMEVEDLRAKSDSQLVTNQVTGEYQTKDPQLMKYLEKVKSLAKQFKTFELVHVPRDHNSRADLLSKLASTMKPDNNRTVIQETISTPSTEASEVAFPLEQEDWRSPIIKYILNDELPSERKREIKFRKFAAHYTMMGDRLYKRGFSSPLLLCVGRVKVRKKLRRMPKARRHPPRSRRTVAKRYVTMDFLYVRSRHSGTIQYLTRAGQIPNCSSGLFYQMDRGGTSGNHLVRKGESANKVILKALKRNLIRKGKTWAEHIPAILWSYHTTIHTSTGETPFKMVDGTDAMIPAKVSPPSWRRETLTAPDNDAALQENLDLLEEVREAAHLREFTAKQRGRRKYDTKVIPWKFETGDLVLKRPMGRDKGGKLAPNWEGPFRIQEVFGGGAYRLETLRGETLPRTWNVANLKYYFS